MFENGKIHGYGEVHNKEDGWTYKGQWKEDKKNGQGVQAYEDKSKYEGEWLDDQKHGKGILYYKNGSVGLFILDIIKAAKF